MMKGLGLHFTRNAAILSTALTTLTPSFGLAQGDDLSDAEIDAIMDQVTESSESDFRYADRVGSTTEARDLSANKGIVLYFNENFEPGTATAMYRGLWNAGYDPQIIVGYPIDKKVIAYVDTKTAGIGSDESYHGLAGKIVQRARTQGIKPSPPRNGRYFTVNTLETKSYEP